MHPIDRERCPIAFTFLEQPAFSFQVSKYAILYKEACNAKLVTQSFCAFINDAVVNLKKTNIHHE